MLFSAASCVSCVWAEGTCDPARFRPRVEAFLLTFGEVAVGESVALVVIAAAVN